MRLKPKNERVRLVYTDDPQATMPEHRGKVFAVIGPFDSFSDKDDLQKMLLTLLRGYNMTTTAGFERKTHDLE